MLVKYMEAKDKEFVMSMDSHVNDILFDQRVYTKTGYVAWKENMPVGVMHYSVLWDHLPFLNCISIKESYRNKGFATQLLEFWEQDIKNQGYKMVLLSTQADESAQHLYRQLGYVDCGGLLFFDTPMDQPMEIFLRKVL